jgi:prefoldin subunit 5
MPTQDRLGDFVRNNIVGIIGLLVVLGAGYASIQVTFNILQTEIAKTQEDLKELEEDMEEDIDSINDSLQADYSEILSIHRSIFELEKLLNQ